MSIYSQITRKTNEAPSKIYLHDSSNIAKINVIVQLTNKKIDPNPQNESKKTQPLIKNKKKKNASRIHTTNAFLILLRVKINLK